VPPVIVTEFIEEPPFQLAFARLARLGPLMDTALRAHIESMKVELIEHRAQPPGAVPHPHGDGSRILVRSGLRLRYFVTKPRRQSWLTRAARRLRGDSSIMRVRVRLHGLDWPGVERLAGS